MVGVITGAEVITMVGVEAEATITGGGTIIAIGNDCWSPALARPTAIRLRHALPQAPYVQAEECVPLERVSGPPNCEPYHYGCRAPGSPLAKASGLGVLAENAGPLLGCEES